MKTSITPTPTDLDKLKDDIAVEVSIVFKHAKLGTDYTINCTNTIASMAENYARALIDQEVKKARIDELNELNYQIAKNSWHKENAYKMYPYILDRIAELEKDNK